MSTDKSATFDKQIKRLQTVVEQLEQGGLSLEKGVELYKEGLRLSNECRQKLLQAKQEITIYKDGLVSDFEGQRPSSDAVAGEVPSAAAVLPDEDH